MRLKNDYVLFAISDILSQISRDYDYLDSLKSDDDLCCIVKTDLIDLKYKAESLLAEYVMYYYKKGD